MTVETPMKHRHAPRPRTEHRRWPGVRLAVETMDGVRGVRLRIEHRTGRETTMLFGSRPTAKRVKMACRPQLEPPRYRYEVSASLQRRCRRRTLPRPTPRGLCCRSCQAWLSW